MSYYQFTKQEVLQEANKRYSKEKAAEYLKNKEEIKEKPKVNIKSCQKKKNTRLKSIKEKNFSN